MCNKNDQNVIKSIGGERLGGYTGGIGIRIRVTEQQAAATNMRDFEARDEGCEGFGDRKSERNQVAAWEFDGKGL